MPSTAAGPGEDALAACSGRDYPTALRLWRPLADQGDAAAQFRVGACYDLGHGVAADRAIAALWYRKAAEQGHANAQHNLGALYYSGHGVRRDLVQAYKWFALADGTENRDHVAKRLSARQLEEAETLVRAWQAKPER